MKLTANMKRILSALLVLVMVFSLIPMDVHAATDSPVDAAIIFSDLHTNKSNYKQSTIDGVFGKIKNTGLPVSSVTSAGDAFSVNEDNSSSNGPYTGLTSTITGYIRNAMGNNSLPVNYVWSDHDRYAVKADGSTLLDKKSQLIYGAGNDGVYGTSDDDNYYVYSLSMGDLCSYDRYKAGFNYTESSNSRASKGYTATVPEAIAGFKAAVAKLDQSKPLLITSHQPLFDNRNDNAWAEDWFDAINEVAENMDVAFFYGHNHKYDSGSDYYYAKGSTMPVATRTLSNGSSWNYKYETGSGYKPSIDLKAKNKVLNFTHMCAGYMEPTSTGSYSTSTTRLGTAIVVTIYEDSITYTTYDNKGVYTGKYAVNANVIRDHADRHEHTYETVTVDATCTTDGSVTVTCTGCGEQTVETLAALGHQYTEVKTDATCAKDGSLVYTCACGDTYTEVIPATGHTYKAVTTAANCSQDGKTVYTCACGDTYTEVIPATGKHTYQTVTVDATCTTEGSKIHTCSVCGDTYTEVIAVIAHSYTAKVTAPTCEKAGYTTYTCACGDTYTADEVAATGHTHKAVTTAATCNKDGKTVYTCVCGDTYTEVIPATGKHTYQKTVTAPTCETAGFVVYTCACGDTYTEEQAATGHNYTTKVTAPTCEKAGYTTYTCACGDTYTADEVAAKGHNYTSKVTAPTCEKAGYTTYTCACGDTYTADEVAATGHNYTAKVTAPTCEKAGYTTYTCACGDTYTDDEVAALGHSYDAVVTEPTNTQGGYTTYTCVCGHSYIGDETEALENSIVVGDASFRYEKVAAGTLEDGYYQLQNNNTGKYLTSTKTNNANRLNLESNGQNHVWYIKAVSGGYTVQYGGPNGQYLTFSHEKAAMSTSAQTIKFLNTNGYWGIGAISGNPAPFLAREGVNTSSTSVHGYASNDYKYPSDVGMDWNLYKRVENQATYSVSASDVHHILTDHSFQLQYALLANGVATDLPAGGSYSFQVSKDTNGIVAGISDQGLITFNNVAGSCYVKITCTWSEGSAYRYVKVTTELDPNYCDHVYTAETVAPTCTEMGYTTHTCTVCGDSYVTDKVAALGHDYESVTVPATCSVDGSVTNTCACGEKTVEILKALGHSYTCVETAATCAKDGSKVYTCSVCGDTYTEVIAATGKHTYQTVTVEATCTTEGSKTHTCSACGDKYVEAIPVTDHTYTGVEADGYMVYTCVCGHSYSEKLAADLSYEKVTSLANNNRYVITLTSGGKYYALSHAGNTISAQQVTVSNGVITSEITDDLVWDYNNKVLSYEENGTTYRLYAKASSLSISNSKSASVTFSSNKVKVGSYYLRYSNNKISLNRSATTANLFKEIEN